MDIYEITREHGYYAVYKNGVFYCSADSYDEAEHDIVDAKREEELCGYN